MTIFFGLIGTLFFSFYIYKNLQSGVYNNDKKLLRNSIILVVICMFVLLKGLFSSEKAIIMDGTENTFDKKNTIIAGDFEYTINSIEKKSSLDFDGGIEEAYGEFIIFDVTVKNNDNHAVFISDNIFNMIDGENQYETDYHRSLDATSEEYDNPSFITRDVNPGIAMSAIIVFDIPKDKVNSDDLNLLIFTDDSAPDNIKITVN